MKIIMHTYIIETFIIISTLTSAHADARMRAHALMHARTHAEKRDTHRGATWRESENKR